MTRVRKILIVEDDPSIRSMLRTIFQLAGYEVVEAANGLAALDLLQGPALPDIVTTDLMMPVMSGGEFIRRLRSDPRTATIPIVVVSANADGMDQASPPPDGMVRKPFRPSLLVDLIRTLDVAASRPEFRS